MRIPSCEQSHCLQRQDLPDQCENVADGGCDRIGQRSAENHEHSAETERDRIKGLYDGLAGAGNDAAGRAGELNKALDSEKQISSRALAQIEVLNQQISSLRRQLAALEEALDASEKRDKESQGRIVDLGQRLNVALAQRVQELSRYRSEFFGRLRAILGEEDTPAPASTG